MAVVGTKVTTAMVLKVKTGVQNGKDVLKSITLKKVKGSAADADIYEVAKSISSILSYPLSSISKQDVNELTNA